MPRVYVSRPVIDRVVAKLVEQDGHWVWTGSVGSSGYGKIKSGGRRGFDLLVHRVVWEHHNGPIPPDLVLDHTDLCLRILCCNPDHLEPVTQAENIRRRTARRTACDKGHKYTPENTHVGPNGRECRTCHAERESQRRVRNRRPDYAERCNRGHERTYLNTVVQGNGLRCQQCTSEAAQRRWAHRDPALLSGSGNP